MNNTYDRLAVGDRLRFKRTLLGWSQDELAEKIGRASKYYADIERGNCGMSIETLLALSKTLNMSTDYILFGEKNESHHEENTDEVKAVIGLLDNCTEKNRNYALRMLKLFLLACTNENEGMSN